MGKLNPYYEGLTGEDRIFVSHIIDMMDICEKSYKPRFSNFLDERQAALALSAVNERKFEKYRFFGGYEDASRKVLGVFPQYEEADDEEFPITAVTFRYRESDKLTHRDFLGAFMSCRVKRDMLGDIVVGNGHATAFVYDTVKQTILSEITKIGSAGVKSEEDSSPLLDSVQSFTERSCSVSALRLDCVVSAAAGISREKAANLIRGGNVSVKYEVREFPSFMLEEGDVFSARGYGKFILSSVGGKTKKDRYHVIIKKYI